MAENQRKGAFWLLSMQTKVAFTFWYLGRTRYNSCISNWNARIAVRLAHSTSLTKDVHSLPSNSPAVLHCCTGCSLRRQHWDECLEFLCLPLSGLREEERGKWDGEQARNIWPIVACWCLVGAHGSLFKTLLLSPSDKWMFLVQKRH